MIVISCPEEPFTDKIQTCPLALTQQFPTLLEFLLPTAHEATAPGRTLLGKVATTVVVFVLIVAPDIVKLRCTVAPI